MDQRLHSHSLNSVSVSQDREKGVMTLNGDVGSNDLKSQAENLAKQAAPDYLFPYVEFVKRDGRVLSGAALVEGSLKLLRHHLAHRPKANPIGRWQEAMPAHLERLAARDMDYFHLYAFNLPRQLGANFEMLGTYLDWLGGNGQDGLTDTAAAARRIAEAAKAAQFQLARMANRRKFDVAAIRFAPIEADYELILSTLVKRFI